MTMTAPVANPALAVHLAQARRLGRWGLAAVMQGLVPALAWLTFAPLASAYVKADLDR